MKSICNIQTAFKLIDIGEIMNLEPLFKMGYFLGNYFKFFIIMDENKEVTPKKINVNVNNSQKYLIHNSEFANIHFENGLNRQRIPVFIHIYK